MKHMYYRGSRAEEPADAKMLDQSAAATGSRLIDRLRSAMTWSASEFMAKNGFVSHVHRKKPKGRVMPKAMRRANNAKTPPPVANNAREPYRS